MNVKAGLELSLSTINKDKNKEINFFLKKTTHNFQTFLGKTGNLIFQTTGKLLFDMTGGMALFF